MKKSILIFLSILALSAQLHAQASYIVEQLGRNEHQIVQSLGAFVGNDQAESQAFDITFMPAGNNVEGVMIINTADYRCTFKVDLQNNECYQIILDVRSVDFLRDFNALFQTYPTVTKDNGNIRNMQFGNQTLRIVETSSTTSRFRSFTITVDSKK